MRARLAIAVSGIAVEWREIVLRNKPPALIAASPKATVPVLVLPDGAVIDESLDVMLWALQQNDPMQWLKAPGGLDRMQALIAHNDGDFKQHLDRYKYPNRYAEEMDAGMDADAFATLHRSQGARHLMQLQAMLVKNVFLLGPSASLADMAILPFVRQFAHTDPDWFAAQPWPQLQAWLAAFEGSALYESVMHKHAPWIDPDARAA
ncbi:MAG: glutathione S-transferase [Polaromonas sp.]|nr:glutathione S-transferase [Polaromonas sp.]